MLLIFAMTCVLLGAQGIAMSEDSATTPPLRRILDVKASVWPSEMVEPGEATIVFEISNNSQYGAENILFSAAGGDSPQRLGRLSPGESQMISLAYAVSEAELEAGELAFYVTHDDINGGDPVKYELSARIVKTEAAPEIEFTRQLSKNEVTKDAAVTITYRVRNVGNVPLSNIVIKDKLGDFEGSVDALACGEDKLFSSRVAIEEDAVSHATATYEAPYTGDKKYERQLDDVSIRVTQPELTAALALESAAAEYGDTISGVITIVAQGADFTDVYVKDDVNGTLLTDSYEIPAGTSVNIACSWPVRAPSDYRLVISGMTSAGDRVEVITNTESVGLTGEFSRSDLKISATAATPVINRAGKARITVAIENTGNTAARDVILREKSLGDVRRFAFIAVGEPTYRDVVVDVAKDTVFEFGICTLDGEGNVQLADTVEIPISIASDGAEPESVEIRDETSVIDWIARNINNKETYTYLLMAAGGTLIILIAILLVSHGREHVSRRQRKARMQHRRQENAGRALGQLRKK